MEGGRAVLVKDSKDGGGFRHLAQQQLPVLCPVVGLRVVYFPYFAPALLVLLGCDAARGIPGEVVDRAEVSGCPTTG